MKGFDSDAYQAYSDAMAKRYDFMTKDELITEIKQSAHQLRHAKPGSREERQIKEDMLMQLKLRTV